MLNGKVGSQLLNSGRVRWIGVNRAGKVVQFQAVFHGYDHFVDRLSSAFADDGSSEHRAIGFRNDFDEADAIILANRAVHAFESPATDFQGASKI